MSRLADVIEAWENPGMFPTYHRIMQQRLRDEWPVLANALEALCRQRLDSPASGE